MNLGGGWGGAEGEREREGTDVDFMFGPRSYRSFTPKTKNV